MKPVLLQFFYGYDSDRYCESPIGSDVLMRPLGKALGSFGLKKETFPPLVSNS